MNSLAGKIFFIIQDGFDNDTVIVYINGVEVFHKTNVKTTLSNVPTAYFEAQTQKNSIEIEVYVPNRNYRDSLKVAVEGDKYVEASIVSADLSPSRIKFFVSNEPFPHY